ncbi:MAG TPA: hypothetical protein VJU83_11460 [Burkholderiales bacterium]|nr:hypothetical protein [Burkholderiales bacterium]
MHYEYPIEQLARSIDAAPQSAFAERTKGLAPEFKDAFLEPSSAGLKILASNEDALLQPQEVIQQMHAGDVDIGAPTVRLVVDEQTVYEPIMWIRAAIPDAHFEDAIHDLIDRGALIEEVDWFTRPPTVRAIAPLRTLMGYSKALADQTESSADLRMWLSHYSPALLTADGFGMTMDRQE